MKATLKIMLRKHYVTKEDKRQVCIRYTAYRKCTFIGLNISIHPDHWNERTQTVKAAEPRALFYNKIIKEMYNKADTVLLEHFFKPLPAKEFISKVKDAHYGNTDFYTFIENEIELLKPSRAAGTIVTIRSCPSLNAFSFPLLLSHN